MDPAESPAAHRHGLLTLIEREAELRALDQALAGAIAGRGSVVAIEGPPGIGKSSLVASGLELARAREMYTISVRATELERSYPYGIVRQTADTVTLDKPEEERAALFTGAAKLALPILDPASAEELDNPELMYQRLHGLYWLIANLSRQQPLLISIDDAQWADEASMAAERFLSLRIADLPMVLLVAARTADVGQLAVPLAEILADPATVSIRPGPLSTEGAGARIQALLGSGDAAFAAACHHATGGNPFLLEQLVCEIRAEGIEPTAASAERVASLGPDTVRASVLLRLERLPKAGGPVARALAILGEHDVALRDVAALAEVPEDDAAEALAELERAGLVTGAPHLRFTHPILRAAIEDDMPAVERSRAHEQAARMLAERDADPVAVAAHLLVERSGPGRLGPRGAAGRGAPGGGARRPVGRREVPGARPRRASRAERARRDPLPARPGGRPRRGSGGVDLPRARGRGRRADSAPSAPLDGRAPPGGRTREQGGRRARGRPRERARGGRGRQAAGRDADRRRAGERHRAPPPRRPLRVHRGAARGAADRLRALRADHARVRLGRGARRRGTGQ